MKNATLFTSLIPQETKQGFWERVGNFFKQQEPLAFRPRLLRDFLRGKGYSGDGENYYLFIENSVRKFGICAIYQDLFFISECDFTGNSCQVWEIPFSSVNDIKRIASKSFKKYPCIILRFSTSQEIKELKIAVAGVVGRVPSYRTVDRDLTLRLFEEFSEKINRETD